MMSVELVSYHSRWRVPPQSLRERTALRHDMRFRVSILRDLSRTKVVQLRCPVRSSEEAYGHDPNISCAQVKLDTGRSLEALVDFIQLFGAVSLFDAASGMYQIAHDEPLAYVGYAFVCSFLAISNLHAVGGALEIFEGEYTRNWAVLGLSWTSNFCGIMIYLIATLSRGRNSIPWLSLVAPTVQTIMLMYALSRVGGWTGRVRIVLMAITVASMIAYAVYVKLENIIEELCDSVSFYTYDVEYSTGYETQEQWLYVPETCWDLSESSSLAGVIIAYDDWSALSFFDARDNESVTADFLGLTNSFPIEFGVVGTTSASLVAICISCVVLVGGSFAVVAMKPTTDRITSCRWLTSSFVLLGWCVAYPLFEIYRTLPRLLNWAESLYGSVARGEYKAYVDGAIALSPGRDSRVGDSLRRNRFFGRGLRGRARVSDTTDVSVA